MDTWKDKLIFDFFLTQKTLVSTYNLLGTVPDFPRFYLQKVDVW